MALSKGLGSPKGDYFQFVESNDGTTTPHPTFKDAKSSSAMSDSVKSSGKDSDRNDQPKCNHKANDDTSEINAGRDSCSSD